MGQESKPIARDLNLNNELKLVDKAQGLYLNLCNQKYYTKTDLFMKDIADIEYELQVFNFRRINQKLVVSVDYCTNTPEREICSSFAKFSYFIEKLPTTLFEKTTSTTHDAIKHIIQALKGFQVLYQQFGYFTPSSKMICFDKANHVKVWINQDFKITKNTQFPHCPKTVSLQNTFIRQVIRLFEYLRDPVQPLFRFSQNLPGQILTFPVTVSFYQQQLRQLQNKQQNQHRILAQVQNRITNQQIERMIPVRIVSHQTSPIRSPCKVVPKIVFQNKSPERQPITSFLSPRASVQPNLQQFKEAVSTSLKNTANTSNFNQMFNVSKEVSSTMPASLKNSGICDRNASVQLHNPYIFKGREIKRGGLQSAALKKQAAQRYSEAQPTSFGRNMSPKTIILEQDSIVKIENLSKQSQNQHGNGKKMVFESIIDSIPAKTQYQTHKRHRTDFQLMQAKSQMNSNINQKSAMEGTLMNRFNINTIKSIHLLEEDRDLDSDIVVDLKHLINKYRQRG